MSLPASRPEIALVHDWLTGMRGGEKVIEALCELYPNAPLFTLVHVGGSVSQAIERMQIRPSLMSRVPGIGRLYRQALPLFPFVIEQFDLDRFDLIISTSHCAAKAVVRTGRARHICYCHTPMRYVWDQRDVYFGPERMGTFAHRLLRPILAGLARWDRDTARRVDRFVANSQHVAERIRRYYNRRAAVVYPPVDTSFYTPDGQAPEPYLLIVSALSPYKRIDLAMDAAQRVGLPLRIVGMGPDRARLESIAGPRVEFLGALSDERVRDLFRRAMAVLLPGEEDFGIAPVEAQACGRPVVALARGGALETVVDGVTGVLVAEPAPDAFADGIRRAERLAFDPIAIRAHALRFGRERFVAGIQTAVDQQLSAN